MNSEPLSESMPRSMKGEGVAHLGYGGADDALALAQHGAGLDPARMDIGEVKGLEKFAVGPVARMRDQVHPR